MDCANDEEEDINAETEGEDVVVSGSEIETPRSTPYVNPPSGLSTPNRTKLVHLVIQFHRNHIRFITEFYERELQTIIAVGGEVRRAVTKNMGVNFPTSTP